MNIDESKEYLTPNEVADLLRTSRQTIYTYLKAGKLKSIKVGRRRLFPKAEVEAFLGSEIETAAKKKIRKLTPELEEAREELKRGDDLRRKRSGGESLELVARIRPVIFKTGANDDLAQMQFIEGSAYLNMGQYAKAVSTLKTALDNSRIADHALLEGRILGTLGGTEGERKNYDKAIAYYDEAQKIFRKIKAKGSIAITYQHLGVLLGDSKRSYDAISHYDRALEIAKSTKMPAHFEPNILISLADCYLTVGDNSQALNFAEKAWKIGKRRKDETLIVRATSQMAKSLYNLHDKESAGEFFRKTLDSWNKLSVNHKDRLISSAINSTIGLDDYSACLKLLRRKDKLLKSKPDSTSDKPWHFLNYGKCFLGLKKPEKALEYMNDALKQQVELGQLDRLLSFHEIRAKCLSAIGDHAAACEEFDEALFHLEAEIGRAINKVAGESLGYFLDEITDHLIDVQFRLSDDETALRYAFDIIARELRLIIGTNAIYPDPIAGRFTARKYVRNTRGIVDFFSSFTSVVPGKLNQSQVKYHTDRMAKLRKSKKGLVDKLVRENPFYLPLQGESGPGVSEIKQLFRKGNIPSGSSLISITLGPSGGQGYLVNKSGIVLRRDLPINRDQARESTLSFLSSCRMIGTLTASGLTPSLGEKGNLNNLLNDLYNNLLKPFVGHFDSDKPLILLTDHSLTHLPFHALFDGERYLCEYLQIYRVLSPAFLRVLQVARQPERKPRLFVVSPWTEDVLDNMLVHVNAIPHKRIKLATGEKAVVGDVRHRIGKYDAFLYIGEQTLHPANPQRMNLRLHEGPGLVAGDFFTQRYDLSGVQSILLYTGGTAHQDNPLDDCFLPIQRGFLTSGANLVGTFLWKLDDSSLGRILDEIYNGFNNNGVVGFKAIREAQVRMIRDTITSHPYFWAGLHYFNLTLDS